MTSVHFNIPFIEAANLINSLTDAAFLKQILNSPRQKVEK